MIQVGDQRVKRIGLGTNRLTDTPANRSFLEGAVAAGVGMIDTAHLYTGGGSETTIGAALAPFPDGLVVATKGLYRGGGPKRLRAELEESLERLRVDAIELYYLHRVDPEASLEETVEVLAEAREAGRIRHVGLSEVTVDQVERARGIVPIAAVQNEYGLGERRYDDVVEHCAANDIAFVPFFPLRGGETAALREIAARHDATPQQVKLAWLLARSPAMLPIPGTLSLEHLEQNLAALEIELSGDEYAELSGSDQ